MGSTRWGEVMTTYTLEELGVKEGDIVADCMSEFEVIDYNTLRCRSGEVYRGFWGGIFILVSRKGPPKKKGYAKWVSEREGI